MSLINDALKRAKAAQNPAAPPTDPTALHFRPVEPSHRARHSLGLLLPVGLAGIALLGLVFLWERVQQRGVQQPVAARAAAVAEPNPGSVTTQKPQPGTPSGAEVATAKAGDAPVTTTPSVAAKAPTPALESATNAAATAVAATMPLSNSAPVPEVAPKPPVLKLQSIVFGSRHPSAMINGRPLFIGDRIGDVRVTAITQDSVTLIGPGKTNVLSLSD